MDTAWEKDVIQRIKKAIQLHHEYVQFNQESLYNAILPIVKGILNEMQTPVYRIGGRGTPEETKEGKLWAHLNGARKGLTTHLHEPVLMHLKKALAVVEPHEPTPEERIKFLEGRMSLFKRIADKGEKWAIEAVENLRAEIEKERRHGDLS